jgi:hypothetical protein
MRNADAHGERWRNAERRAGQSSAETGRTATRYAIPGWPQKNHRGERWRKRRAWDSNNAGRSDSRFLDVTCFSSETYVDRVIIPKKRRPMLIGHLSDTLSDTRFLGDTLSDTITRQAPTITRQEPFQESERPTPGTSLS